ncbi:MAG: porin [Litorilituus sp.]|jgi:hypothetical protein|nr:porin [Litorilituus sp.]
MKKLTQSLLFSSMLVTYSAHADIAFNGFASIVGGVTTSNDEQLDGYDNTLSFDEGSLFAIQASSELGEGLSVTAQILSRGENDWKPDFEWAYVAYEANDNLRLLAGRQRIPFYMYSDFLDVSYAYPWISPPAGVYSTVINTFDGIGAIYSTNLDEFDVVVHGIYGNSDGEISVDTELTGKADAIFDNITGASMAVTRDWLTLRAAYFQADSTIGLLRLQPLVDGWSAAGFNDIADNISVFEDKSEFVEFGFQAIFDTVQVIGEYTELTTANTTVGDEDSYYIMVSKQFDTILASITYAVDEDHADAITGGVPTGVSPQLDALIALTNGATDAQEVDVTSITLGLRWDFHDSAALKFEYIDYSDDLNSDNDTGLLKAALVTVF